MHGGKSGDREEIVRALAHVGPRLTTGRLAREEP